MIKSLQTLECSSLILNSSNTLSTKNTIDFASIGYAIRLDTRSDENIRMIALNFPPFINIRPSAASVVILVHMFHVCVISLFQIILMKGELCKTVRFKEFVRSNQESPGKFSFGEMSDHTFVFKMVIGRIKFESHEIRDNFISKGLVLSN